MTIKRPTPQMLPALGALWQEAFGDSEAFIDLFFRHGFSYDRCLTLCREELLGAVYWFDCTYSGFRYAYVYALGVKKTARGEGIGRSLMEGLHRHLEKLGYGGCLLCPAEESLFGYYSRLGYTTCACMDSFRCTAGTAIPLEQLAVEEYTRRRNALLPADAARFDIAALDYLSAYTGLYGGGGFVLAAYRDGDSLVGSELLGDRTKAPGILAALGCREGSFKVPGDTPQVMFYPLRTGVPAPGYLGLVLN